MAQTLAFSEGGPNFLATNMHLLRHDIPNPGPGQVLVKMLAAPINPLDLLVLQNEYPVKPQSREQGQQIPGYDGVGRILKCGESITKLATGDHVIIKRHGLGTWRTHGLFNAQDIMKVPNELDTEAASILRMGILVAYLLLERNSVQVRPGGWIVLNAATGVIAHFLAQFAHKKGLRVISVIRDRSGGPEAKKAMKKHGSDIVLEESELAATSELEGKKIVLALDSVFGAGGMKLVEKLSVGATYVSYGYLGGISPDRSIHIGQQLFFQKDITFKGFRFSTALSTLGDGEETSLYSWVSEMLQKGELTMPFLKRTKWDPEAADEELLRQAVRTAQKAEVGQRKTIFVFS